MEVTGNLAEYAMRPHKVSDDGKVTEYTAPLYDIEDGKAKPAFDERRGEHLLSPGDLVRYGAAFWEVTGVHLAASTQHSVVSMRLLGDKMEEERVVPLVFLDSCHLYLLADRRPK